MSYLPLITKTLLPPPPPLNPAKNAFKKAKEIVIILALKVSAFWVYGLICKGKVSVLDLSFFLFFFSNCNELYD